MSNPTFTAHLFRPPVQLGCTGNNISISFPRGSADGLVISFPSGSAVDIAPEALGASGCVGQIDLPEGTSPPVDLTNNGLMINFDQSTGTIEFPSSGGIKVVGTNVNTTARRTEQQVQITAPNLNILLYLQLLISWVICDHSPDQTMGYWGVPKIGGYHGQGVILKHLAGMAQNQLSLQYLKLAISMFQVFLEWY